MTTKISYRSSAQCPRSANIPERIRPFCYHFNINVELREFRGPNRAAIFAVNAICNLKSRSGRILKVSSHIWSFFEKMDRKFQNPEQHLISSITFRWPSNDLSEIFFDYKNCTELNRSRCFRIFMKIQFTILRKIVIMVSFRGMLSVELTVFRSIW